MGDNTKIEWTATVHADGTVTQGATWNPVRGCSMAKGSETGGCLNCYAARQATRFSGPGKPFEGFARIMDSGPRWTGKVELVEKHLLDPLKWKEPRKIFVNSMSDLFHESLADYEIDRVFAVIALCPQHCFQILTKRPERMKRYFSGDCLAARIAAFQWEIIEDRVDPNDRRSDDIRATAIDPSEEWPLPNVWLGVSCEDQKTADERIPGLLKTPAAVRFVSYEPALGPVDFTRIPISGCGEEYDPIIHANVLHRPSVFAPHIHWIIVGGESGPGARPFNIQWARDVIQQCREAGVACFVKQLGAKPEETITAPSDGHRWNRRVVLRDRKGGDWNEWPENDRVRQFPQVRA